MGTGFIEPGVRESETSNSSGGSGGRALYDEAPSAS